MYTSTNQDLRGENDHFSNLYIINVHRDMVDKADLRFPQPI